MLAGILTDFGSRTGPVAFGGRGEFDGVMTGPFRRPRVEGRFSGEDLRAWDTVWGDGDAHIVVENNYVTVTDGVDSPSTARRFAPTGCSRSAIRARDGGEEIDARFRVTRRDVDSLRHAFEIDDYPVSGLLSGEFHLTGEYETPVGFGAMTIDDGVAYGEPFEHGDGGLRFDGAGVRLDNVPAHQSRAGMVEARRSSAGTRPTRSTRRPAHSDGADGDVRLSRGAAVRPHRVHGRRQRHVRRAALRRPVPRQRSVRRRRRASGR